MTTAPTVAWWAIARRVVERHWSVRLALGALLGIPAAGAWASGHAWLGATLIATLVATLAWALATAEPARLRRLARRAVTSLPDHSGDVVLRGVVAAVDVPLIEPASGAACAAMWSRSVDTSEGESTITEVGDAAPFVVRCGDALIAVATTLIEVLADPAQAQTRAHPERHRRDEWITAGVGDAVIVAGVLHPGASSDPYRGTAQLTAAPGRRVIIGLLGTPRSAS